jgi:geranylgeranyl diphosphate synthase type I
VLDRLQIVPDPSSEASAPAVDADPTGLQPIPPALHDGIADILEAFVSERHSLLAPMGHDLDPLVTAARRALSGGKRLRPAFVYWGWRSSGGSKSKTSALLRAAAAVELVHASALVHDDVLDEAETRRGSPTAHRMFAALEADPRGSTAPVTSRRFGTSAAILLGDLLLAWSDELLAESGFKPKALGRGREYFGRMRTEMLAGQYLDVLMQARGRSSGPDAMRVLRYKSAKYTVERPLQIGAALAKASPELLAALSSYGVPLGEAFQLRDDVLGVFGDAASTGKPIGDDIREGKPTLLVARAYDKADAGQREILEAALGDRTASDEAVEAACAVIRATGALQAVETVIGELTAAALAALAVAPIDEEAALALRTLADRATHRDR